MMTFFRVTLVLALLCFSLLASGNEQNIGKSPLVRISLPEKGKCRVNICFAFQGSTTLNAAEFFSQKRFIIKVVNSINARNDLNVSAVEYGLDNKVISPITSDIPRFLDLLRNATFTRAPTNFISGGLLYCQGQLRKNADDPDKIVLLGSGKSDFGGDPVTRAAPFLESGGDIFALGVGEFDREALTDIVGGDGSRVFELGSKADDEKILQPFLSKLCGLVDDGAAKEEPVAPPTVS